MREEAQKVGRGSADRQDDSGSDVLSWHSPSIIELQRWKPSSTKEVAWRSRRPSTCRMMTPSSTFTDSLPPFAPKALPTSATLPPDKITSITVSTSPVGQTDLLRQASGHHHGSCLALADRGLRLRREGWRLPLYRAHRPKAATGAEFEILPLWLDSNTRLLGVPIFPASPPRSRCRPWF